MTGNLNRAMRSDTIKKGFDPRTAPRLAAGHRRHSERGRLRQAVHRRLQLLRADHPRPRAPGRGRRRRCARRCGRRAACPFEFNTIGVDDGIAMGHVGMKYSLPSRELIADCVETMLARPLLRRHGLHPQLRQDRAGHADGGRCG